MRDQPDLYQTYTVRYPSGAVHHFHGIFELIPGPRTHVVYPMITHYETNTRYALDPRGIVTVDTPGKTTPIYSPRDLQRHQFIPEIVRWFDQHPEWPQPDRPQNANPSDTNPRP